MLILHRTGSIVGYIEMGDTQQLILLIETFCKQNGVAESTFGRIVVNDGKFVGRLRAGKGITLATMEKVHFFLKLDSPKSEGTKNRRKGLDKEDKGNSIGKRKSLNKTNSKQNDPTAFRFYDNRQKYLMFVNTCSEKWVVAERAGMELANIKPSPPAFRLFDAGMGDGTVLTGVMRHMHHRFPNQPFYIVGKEISLEDIRLTLEKMPDRFNEHPATVLVVTNLYYTEAPNLVPNSLEKAAALNWLEVPLQGDSSYDFHEQIKELQPILSEHWQVKSSNKTGNPLYLRPSVLIIYRHDHKFLLEQVIPKLGKAKADYDLIIASQPYRARMSVDFKIKNVLSPLSKALASGGRLLGIHSSGNDPGLEIVQSIWPGEEPFRTNRHELMRELKKDLGNIRKHYNYNVYADKRSIFRYDMHTLPSEVTGSSIGTSTLMAAWNAAIYVCQIEDERLEDIIHRGKYLEATRDILNKHNGLWFNDESFVVSRKRER